MEQEMKKETPTKIIWILGLNHSGTTVFWRAFLNDPRFRCFDEPFSPNLGQNYPKGNSKGTSHTIFETFGNDPEWFWGLYAPIWPTDELRCDLSARQQDWLSALTSQPGITVIDETNFHNKLDLLDTGDVHVIHLHRRASGFVTSHLLPSWKKSPSLAKNLYKKARQAYERRVFWSRQDYPPGMERASVLGFSHYSQFGLLLEKAGYDAATIMSSPTVVRFLAYWHYSYNKIEREGPRIFGSRFKSVSYDEFARDPSRQMQDIYSWLGIASPTSVDYSKIHYPKLPFQANSDEWRQVAKQAGFNLDECETLI